MLPFTDLVRVFDLKHEMKSESSEKVALIEV